MINFLLIPFFIGIASLGFFIILIITIVISFLLALFFFSQDFGSFFVIIASVATLFTAIATFKSVQELRNQRDGLQLPHLSLIPLNFSATFNLDHLFIGWTEGNSNLKPINSTIEKNGIGVSIINDGVGIAHNVHVTWFFNSRKYLTEFLEQTAEIQHFVQNHMDELFPIHVQDRIHDIDNLPLKMKNVNTHIESGFQLLLGKQSFFSSIMPINYDLQCKNHIKLPDNFLTIYPIFIFVRSIAPVQGGSNPTRLFDHDIGCIISYKDIFSNSKETAYIGTIIHESCPCTKHDTKISGNLYFEEIPVKDFNKFI